MNKLTDDLNIIQNLSNQPTETAEELKAKFDEAGKIIKNFINNVVEPAVTGIEGDYVKSGELTEYKNEIVEKLETFEATLKEYEENVESQIGLATSFGDFLVTTHKHSMTLGGGAESNVKPTHTQEGYYPLGIVGEEITNVAFNALRSYLSDRANGSCVMNIRVRNDDEGNTRTGSYIYYILWVKVKEKTSE